MHEEDQLTLSFTPPKTTATRTIDFAAYIPPHGTFVEVTLDPSELAEVDVRPGRYAITFSVRDEDGKPVGKARSGNPFRLGSCSHALFARDGPASEVLLNDLHASCHGSWNPAVYRRFEDERTRPAAELLARVPLAQPRLAYDLGCGPGNSTELLVQRFPSRG